MGSETLPSACYILSDESSIPFYSTSNGYNERALRIVIKGLNVLIRVVEIIARLKELGHNPRNVRGQSDKYLASPPDGVTIAREYKLRLAEVSFLVFCNIRSI